MNSILEVIIPSAIVLAAGLIIVLGLGEKKNIKKIESFIKQLI